MANEETSTSFKNAPDSNPIARAAGSGVVHDPAFNPGALSDVPDQSDLSAPIAPAAPPKPSLRSRLIMWGGVSAVALLILGATGVAVLSARKDAGIAASHVAKRFDTVKIPLVDFGLDVKDIGSSRTVIINGALAANGSFVITPSSQPVSAQLGQIYFDQVTNKLSYYNGEGFVSVADEVAAEAGVLSIQGQVGNVVLAGGRGIAVSGTTITNTGIISVTSGSPSLTVTNDGSGNITLTGSGAGTISSSGGTIGQLPLFTTSQNIEDSIISQSGLSVTIAGSLALNNALSVGNGGTGATSLAANGVIIGNGASALTSVAAGAAGLCLVSTAGAPAWGACSGGSVVSSLNSLAGDLNLANATAAGSTITIDDASAIAKGIASFNSTNFTVSNGAVNTVQNIDATATPTFSGVNTNNITPSAALTVGSTSQQLILQGGATTVLRAVSGANTTSVGFASPVANTTLNFPALSAGSYTICTTSGNCTAAGSAGGDLTGSYPNPTIASLQGGTLTITAVSSGDILQYNGSAWVNQGISGDITLSSGAVATIANGVVTSAKIADGTIANGDLSAGSFTNITGVGTLTAGALGAGFTAVSVGQGGTGVTTFTANGVLYGNGTGAIGATAAGTTGQCLVGSTGGAPVWAACTGLVTLQDAYNNSTNPEFVLDATRGALTVRDNATPIGANLLEVQSNDGLTTYLAVTSSGAVVTGTFSASGNLNSSGGSVQTNGTDRIDNSGNLTNIGNLIASGAITIASSGATNDVVIDGADQFIVQDAALLNSTVALASLGSADTAGYLCLNSSNLVATCNTTGSGAAFIQGGNSFGADGDLGTNDLNALNLRTNGTTRLTVGASGGVTLASGNSLTLAGGDSNITATNAATGVTGTTTGTGTSTTTLTLTTDAFNVNDVIYIDNAGEDFFTRITSDAGAGSYTVSPAITFESGRTVTKYTVQNIGATTTDYATLGNRFFQGYFAGGIVTGTGSTIYSDQNITSAGRLQVSTVAGSSVYGFKVDTVMTGASGIQVGNSLGVTLDPGGASSGAHIANSNLVNMGSTGTAFTGDIVAGLSQVNWSGAGNTSDTGKVIGSLGKVVTNSGAGSLQNAIGIMGELQYAGGTTVTNSYNVYSANLKSGATTNFYGLYSENLTGGTNNYPLYLDSGTAGQPLLSVTNAGATIFRNSTDSTSAFQVQNTTGTAVLSIDTVNNLIGNPSMEIDTAGWSAHGSAAISRITTQYHVGNASLQAATTAAAGDGAKFTYGLASSTQYSFSVYVKTDVIAPFGNALEIGYSENGSTDTSCSTNQALFGYFARYTCTFTTGTVSGSPYLYIKQVDTSARNIWIDGVRLEAAASASRYSEGNASVSGAMAINSGTSMLGSTSSTLYVQAASGGEGVVVRGNGDGNVFQNAFQITTADGTTILNVNDTSKGTAIQGGSAFLGASALQVVSTDSGARALEVRAASGQTADVLQIVNNGGSSMFSVGATGSVTLQNTADSTAALSIKNAAGNTILSVDTSGGNQNNLITNPSFETDTTGWAAKGTPTTFARDTTQYYNGSASVKFTTQAVADQGIKYDVTLADSTTYNILFYAKTDSASDNDFGQTLSAGYSSDGTTDTNATCTVRPTGAIKSTTWQAVRCTFTTPSSHSGTPFFYIKSGSAAVETYYIDAVLLQTSDNADSNYRDGKVSLQGTIVSPVTIQDTNGNGTFFSIQNSQGSEIFSITNGLLPGGYTDNLITNSDFELNTAGWTAVGSGTTIQRRPGQAYMGYSSMHIVTGASADSGAKFVTGNSGPTALDAAINYAISFYAKSASGTLSDITMAYSYDGNAASEAGDTCTTFSVSTTSWTRVECVIITNASAPTANAYVIIKQETSTSSQSFYVDGVQVTNNYDNVPGAYGTASINLSGTIISPVSIRPLQSSNDAFAVQDPFGITIFQVDTNMKLVHIGDQYNDPSFPSLLVLDTSTSASDRTGVPNGAMYYNSTMGKLRCYENSIWKDCDSPYVRLIKASDESTASDTTLSNDSDMAFTMAANTAYEIKCHIFFSTADAPDFKFATTGPATPSGVRTERRAIAGGATAYSNVGIDTAATASQSVVGTGTQGAVELLTQWYNGANSGTWAFQWAQNTSSATTTSVLRGSYCEYRLL